MDETWTLIHKIHSALDVAAMMSSPGRRDQPITRQFLNQCPTAQSGSVEGSTLLRKVGGIDRSRATEARNLERFWMKARFEAPSTRFRRSTPDEEPSDPAV
jgi:hypothetical protein